MQVQALSLVEMLATGPADHLTLNGCDIHVAPGFALPVTVLPAEHAKLDERVSFADRFLVGPTVAIDRTSWVVLEIVAVPSSSHSASHPPAVFDIELSPRAHDAAFVACRNQPEVGSAVSVFHRGGGHFYLIDRLALGGIDGTTVTNSVKP